MNVKDKRFLVAGTGRSGASAAELLKKMGISTRLFDGNEKLDIEAFYQKHPLLDGMEILLGGLTEEEMEQTDILVLSPGIPSDLPMVEEMRKKGVIVWGAGNYRNERQDDDDSPFRRNFKKLFQRRMRSGQYWDTLYKCGFGHGTRNSDCGGNQQFPVRNGA